MKRARHRSQGLMWLVLAALSATLITPLAIELSIDEPPTGEGLRRLRTDIGQSLSPENRLAYAMDLARGIAVDHGKTFADRWGLDEPATRCDLPADPTAVQCWWHWYGSPPAALTCDGWPPPVDARCRPWSDSDGW